MRYGSNWCRWCDKMATMPFVNRSFCLHEIRENAITNHKAMVAREITWRDFSAMR